MMDSARALVLAALRASRRAIGRPGFTTAALRCLPGRNLLTEGRRTMDEDLLLRCAATVLAQGLLGIEQRALLAFGESLEPSQGGRRDAAADRDRDIDRTAEPAAHGEQHDDPALVRPHPLRQGAVADDPTAVEAHTRARPMGVVVAAAAGTVRTGMARRHLDATDVHAQPTVAAGRAWLAATAGGSCCWAAWVHLRQAPRRLIPAAPFVLFAHLFAPLWSSHREHFATRTGDHSTALACPG